MAGSHVAHDCKVGNHVTFANNVVLGGHVSVGDFTFLGGQAAVRQFVRIAEGAMIVGLSGIRADIIPWGMAQGPLAHLVGINVVGLRRRGYAKADILRVRQAYRALFLATAVSRPPGAGRGMVCGRSVGCAHSGLYPRRQKAALDGEPSRRRCG